MRMAIQARWLSMGGPSSMRNASMGVEHLGHVRVLFFDKLLELGDLTDLFECENFILLVTIHSQTCRVVASIFQTRKTFEASAEARE